MREDSLTALFGTSGIALYFWVAVLIVVVAVALEVILLRLRGRNIRQFLGFRRERS